MSTAAAQESQVATTPSEVLESRINIPNDCLSLQIDQDARFIRYFETQHQRHVGTRVLIAVQTGSIPFLPTHRRSLRLSSETFRCAFLVLASFMEARRTTEYTLQYLAKFYPQFIRAIEAEEYIDVFYSCFTNLVYCFMSDESIPIVINHCRGLWSSFNKLQEGALNVGDDELFVMESLLQVVLRSLVLQNDSLRPSERQTWVEPMEKLLVSLDTSRSNVYKPPTSPLLLNPSGFDTGIVTLAIHFHFRFDQYLFQARAVQRNSKRMVSLKNVLDKITTAIAKIECPEIQRLMDQIYHSSNVASLHLLAPERGGLLHYPNIPPPEEAQGFRYHRFALAVLYYSTLLVANTLSPDLAQKNKTVAFSAAISLCRLCSMSTICNCLAIRSLLLAGLVLAEKVHEDSMRPKVKGLIS